MNTLHHLSIRSLVTIRSLLSMRTGLRRIILSWLVLGPVLFVITGCPTTTSLAPPKASQGQDISQEDARAMDSMGSPRWYDSSARTYRAPQVPPERDIALRRDGTIAGPTSTTSNRSWFSGSGRSWFSGTALGYAVLITLGLALLIGAVALAIVSLRNWRPRADRANLAKAIAIDPTRVSDLPFEAQAEMADPLAYAKLMLSQGNYDQAIIFLYGYMLLAADRAGKITLHRGKTNRMYLHELHSERGLRDLMQLPMLAFEDVFFGRHRMEAARFLAIWEQLDAFHGYLAPTIAPSNASAARVAL